ncbi:MAG: hypothetical protein SFW67_35445 [Myxococcaceae bacterium]|nr:hypothetical protein [Myxococcaceae bacterium]
MRVLTVRQPWAWALAAGLKRQEMRSWRVAPGPLLLHAGSSVEPDGLDAVVQRWGCAPDAAVLAAQRGRLVAVLDVLTGEPPAWDVRVLLVLPLPTAPRLRGRLGLWRPPAEELSRVQGLLASSRR